MPEKTLDTAIADLGAAAEHALEPIVASKMDAFAARGHQIISENLERAKVLAATYPAVGALLPVIEGTLRSLFAHILTGPDATPVVAPPSRVESAAPVLQRRPAEVASDAPAEYMTPEAASADLTAVSTEGLSPVPAAEAALPFPPIRDDKVQA